MAGQTPPAFHPPGSFRQLDPRVDLPSVDPWASPPVIGGGSFSMNSPDTLVTEPPTLRPPLGEFDWGAELSNHPPVFPSLPGLEGCISTRKQYITVQSSCSNDLAFLTKYSEFSPPEYQRHQSPSS